MWIEITLPVLNERQSLRGQVVRLIDYLRDVSPSDVFSIVIADNGSTDGTDQVAQALVREFDNIRFIRLEAPGVGSALQASWTSSAADVVGYMDLDLATDLRHFNEVLLLLSDEGVEVVNASRLKPGAQVSGRRPLRELSSRSLNALLRLVFETRISDAMCGFKFARRELVPDALAHGATSSGWFFAAEFLIVLESRGKRIVEIPVSWQDDRSSKVKILRLSTEYLKAIRRLKGVLREQR